MRSEHKRGCQPQALHVVVSTVEFLSANRNEVHGEGSLSFRAAYLNHTEQENSSSSVWMRSLFNLVERIIAFVGCGYPAFHRPFHGPDEFCVRYACDMFAVGAELSDWQSGDFHIIREYMKPIPR